MCSRIGKAWNRERKQGRRKQCALTAVATMAALGGLLMLGGNAHGQITSSQFGWQPLAQDGNLYYGNYWGDLDWTGLTYTPTYTFAAGFNGTSPNPTTHYWQIVDGALFGLPDINTLGVSIDVHGNPTTYKWQWIPPTVPRDQSPNWQYYPTPALFVLGRVDSSLAGRVFGPQTHIEGLLGVVGEEWMKCNLDSPRLGVTGIGSITNPVLNTGSASLLSRAVLSAGNSNTASVEITPTAEGDGYTAPDPQTGHPTGSGEIDFSVGSKGFPITLFDPYPFGLPQMGDDINKFVYDSTWPIGILTLPLGAQIIGADQSDTQWLVEQNRVGWAVRPTIAGFVPYTKQAQGDKVLPVTNGQPGVAKYEGLPDEDAAFGLKELFLKVEGHDSQRTFIQTFFSATATNHPNPTNDFSSMFLPNWFYYYNKMFPAAPAVYENGDTSHCDSDIINDPQPYHFAIVTGVYIDNNAFESWKVPVFVPGTDYLQFDGFLFVNGIHTYIETVGHELGHKWDIEHGLLNRKYRASDAWNQGFDVDGDGILNSAEEANRLDPRNSDTTNFMGGSINGDVEVLAYIHGLANLLPNKDAWKRDWSDAGLQYAGLFNSFWGPDNPDQDFRNYWGWPANPTSNPYFPWDYQTGVAFSHFIVLSGQHYPDPAGNAVTRVKNPFQDPYSRYAGTLRPLRT